MPVELLGEIVWGGMALAAGILLFGLFTGGRL